MWLNVSGCVRQWLCVSVCWVDQLMMQKDHTISYRNKFEIKRSSLEVSFRNTSLNTAIALFRFCYVCTKFKKLLLNVMTSVALLFNWVRMAICLQTVSAFVCPQTVSTFHHEGPATCLFHVIVHGFKQFTPFLHCVHCTATMQIKFQQLEIVTLCDFTLN